MFEAIGPPVYEVKTTTFRPENFKVWKWFRPIVKK